MSEMADRIGRVIAFGIGTDETPEKIARNVLEAMREPTGDMIHAGLMAGCRINTVEGWRAMVDEASK